MRNISSRFVRSSNQFLGLGGVPMDKHADSIGMVIGANIAGTSDDAIESRKCMKMQFQLTAMRIDFDQ